MEDGALWATLEEFPGVFATGDTPEELRACIQEGPSFYVAEAGEHAGAVRVSPLAAMASVRLALG